MISQNNWPPLLWEIFSSNSHMKQLPLL